MTTLESIITEVGNPGLLTFKFKNTVPVSVDDISMSLNALSQSYYEYLIKSDRVPIDDNLKLYVDEFRTGSIIATFRAIADQGQFVFGDNNVAAAFAYLYEHVETVAGFVTHINDIVQYFLGTAQPAELPTKKETEQIIKIFEPVAKDKSSQFALQFNGTVNIDTINVTYNSQQANAVQNNAKRYLGPALPSNEILEDEVLTLHQLRGITKSQAGDKGIIESISKIPVKLWYASNEIKKAILESHENPFRQAFLVDVAVKTVGDKPALYKVLALKEAFEKP